MDETENKDCQRIAKVFADHEVYISVDQARDIWDKRSSAWCAGWLSLPDNDEELYQDCLDYGL